MMYSNVLRKNKETKGFDLVELYYEKKIINGVTILDAEIIDPIKEYKNIDIERLEKKISTSEELEEAINKGFYIDDNFNCFNFDKTICQDIKINFINKYKSEETLPDTILITKNTFSEIYDKIQEEEERICIDKIQNLEKEIDTTKKELAIINQEYDIDSCKNGFNFLGGN